MRAATAVALALAAGLATPAAAAIGTAVTVQNDQIFRGRSQSAGRPTASLDLSWDDPDGPYAGLTTMAVLPYGTGPRPLGVLAYGGYARRLRPDLTLDLGATNAHFTRRSSGARNSSYTELYVGLIGTRLASHLSFSPHYYRTGSRTLYGDVDGNLPLSENWRIAAHAGLLARLTQPADVAAQRFRYDWRLGLSRRLGRFDAGLAWAGGGPGSDSYRGRQRGHDAIVVSLGASF